jgi:16S rRNA (cytosine967-C5)-methyltransferase
MLEIQRLSTLALTQVLAGKNLDHALTNARTAAHGILTDHQRASIQDCTYGVLRHRTELEQVIAALCQKGKPQPPLDTLFLVAAYQLLHTRLAPHAVVGHAVDVAATLANNENVRGFVNAVLRNLLRNKDELLEQAHATLEGQYSHPTWWIEQLRQDYPEDWEDFLREAQQRPPMTLRVNRRNSSREQYISRLAEMELKATPMGEDALILEEPTGVDGLPGFARGDVSVQDLSAQYASFLLNLRSGLRVLDACAAPGGKSAHILERANGIELWCLDTDAGRLKKSEANLARLKLSSAHHQAVDACDTEKWWDGQPFQRILIDAPCSGSGVVRRHPDIKWLRREEDIPRLAAQQQRLLDTLWPLLGRGGRLVYATCSLFRAENQEQAAAFAQRHSDAKPVALVDEPFRDGLIKPDRFHDGFFYAVFQKD